MKTRQQKQAVAISFAGLLSVLFMNGSFVNWDEANLGVVDLKARNLHARELLGSSYRASAARFHEANGMLSKDILTRVKRSLPKAYHKQAGALTKTIVRESHRYGFDPIFVLAVIQTESKWNPTAIGSVGEIGLMQVRPETAEWMANQLKLAWRGKGSLKNPVMNVTIGIAYMARLRQQMGPNAMKYVSAYNMGPTAVRRMLAQKRRPAEYRARVMDNYEMLYRTLPAAGSIAAI